LKYWKLVYLFASQNFCVHTLCGSKRNITEKYNLEDVLIHQLKLMLFRCNRYGRKLLPVGIYNTAQRRIVSNKPFAKKYGGASGIGIMVVGASYAVLGGAVLVFLGSVVSYTEYKVTISSRTRALAPTFDSIGNALIKQS